MLPEQFLREFIGCPVLQVPAYAYLAFWSAFTGRRLHTKPHTLTGDEWRKAMDKADAQTDKALNAVY